MAFLHELAGEFDDDRATDPIDADDTADVRFLVLYPYGDATEPEIVNWDKITEWYPGAVIELLELSVGKAVPIDRAFTVVVQRVR